MKMRTFAFSKQKKQFLSMNMEVIREIIRQWIKNRINKLEQDFNDL